MLNIIRKAMLLCVTILLLCDFDQNWNILETFSRCKGERKGKVRPITGYEVPAGE
jgi:hypothetical protein